MIRRSTLILLTCLSALSVPAIQTKSVAAFAPVAEPIAKNMPYLRSQSDSSQPVGSRSVSIQTAKAPSAATQFIVAQAETNTFNNLGIGSKGEPVKLLQNRLKEAGYYSGRLDGLYGLETRRAVVALQKSSGLEETGTLDDDTWQALQGSSADSTAESVAQASNVSDVPVAASTESELPPASEVSDEPDAVKDGRAGGIGRVFGLSLGLVALLASFGIGFYIANKGKREVEETEGWDAPDPQSGKTGPVLPSSPAAGYPVKTGSLSLASTQANSTSVNSPAGVQAGGMGGQLGTQASGQIGSTVPLSQVDIIDGLVGELRNPDPVKRRKVIWELGQRGNSIAVQPLVDAMADADSKEKSLLLASLSEIGIRSLKPMNRALAIALQDNNPEVRKNAIRDLSRIYDLVIQISHMLGHATEDEDPEVRQTATWALDKLNHIRKVQDVDSNMRSFTGAGTAPIDLLSSEASIRRSKEMR